MSRLIPRILAVSVVLVFGVIAIAQALRGSQTQDETKDDVPQVTTKDAAKSELRPIVDSDQTATPDTPADPFTASRFVPVQSQDDPVGAATTSRFSQISAPTLPSDPSRALAPVTPPPAEFGSPDQSTRSNSPLASSPPPPDVSRFSSVPSDSTIKNTRALDLSSSRRVHGATNRLTAPEPSAPAVRISPLPADFNSKSEPPANRTLTDDSRFGANLNSQNRGPDGPDPNTSAVRITPLATDFNSKSEPPANRTLNDDSRFVADLPSKNPDSDGQDSSSPIPRDADFSQVDNPKPVVELSEQFDGTRSSSDSRYPDLPRIRNPAGTLTDRIDISTRTANPTSEETGERVKRLNASPDDGYFPRSGFRSNPTDITTAIVPSTVNDDLGTVASPIHPSESQTNGSGKPGPVRLEGLQSPTLSMEKLAPSEIQVGKPAEFQIKVRNVGAVAATNVVIRDQVPEGTHLISTTPPPARSEQGVVEWQLGTLEAGDETTITLQIMPETEGEIGSVATANFQTAASVRTIATRPLLSLKHSAPSKVNIGGTVTLHVIVSNPGTGEATNVILEEDVPDGLTHPAGKALEFEVGILKPGETRELDLTLQASEAGIVQNRIVARADANLVVDHSLELEVIAPQLRVSLEGPKKRYLEKQATYTINVANPGTAPAMDIELVTYLPKGLKYLEANNAGQYDPETHAVYWSLAELPPNQMGSVRLKALPTEMGEHKLRVDGRAATGLNDTLEKTVIVDGLASLFFEVSDTADPIEVGEQTIYEIRLVNEGSKSSTNIRVEATLPAAMKVLNADGPTRADVTSERVAFQPLTRLSPGGDVFFKLQVQSLAAGDQRIRVQVLSDEMQTPVSEEESTRVYADQ